MTAKIGVITFPGTLDDVDAARAVRYAGADAVSLWHADDDLKGVDALAPVMRSVIDAAHKGMPVLGICNGFQILTESKLLPGALTRNEGLHFHCVDTFLTVENNTTAWTNTLDKGQDILIPSKHGEGRFQASAETIAMLEGEGRVVFRYTDNFNGSMNAIAGICSENQRVVGLMPHPEHAIDLLTGPSTDGLQLFLSAVGTFAA